MQDLSTRIHAVVDELCEIQQELNTLILRPEQRGVRMVEACADIEGVNELKLVVDQIRQFLWFYQQVTNSAASGEATWRSVERLVRDPALANSTMLRGLLDKLKPSDEYALAQIASKNGKLH